MVNSQTIEHLKSLIKNPEAVVIPQLPDVTEYPLHQEKLSLGELPYKLGDSKATRKAYGDALVRLAKTDTHRRIVSCDADVSNSTFSETYWKVHKEQCVECFIAE